MSQVDLENWLDGVVIVAGDGSIDLHDHDKVFVAIVHDGSGFNPASAIFALQNRFGSKDAALEAAFELLEEWEREHHPPENDEEEEFFTEGWDGKVWALTPLQAAHAISTNKRAMKHVEIIKFMSRGRR